MMESRTTRFAARPPFRIGLIACLALSACHDSGTDPGPDVGPPAAIVVRAGADQVGTVGAPLSLEVVVQVVDADGDAVPGATISLVPAQGSGSFEPSALSTDDQGEAAATWTLGTAAGGMSARALSEIWTRSSRPPHFRGPPPSSPFSRRRRPP